jgi:hypothetical protein
MAGLGPASSQLACLLVTAAVTDAGGVRAAACFMCCVAGGRLRCVRQMQRSKLSGWSSCVQRCRLPQGQQHRWAVCACVQNYMGADPWATVDADVDGAMES